ncbi:hypothetical protein EVAR_30977_1 [Eumeta japonica]|uniref:Uncharacterized protein n=1 Tax=Eumeta variegata TaxID=151549 RepID=A0A4C1W9Y2_EUMVA|nr:hypothetical protein EVAR_30977_1 [Eumeta japonica]
MVWESVVRPQAHERHRLAYFEWSEPSAPTYFVLVQLVTGEVPQSIQQFLDITARRHYFVNLKPSQYLPSKILFIG